MTPFAKINRVTSAYGMRTLRGKQQMHRGVDVVPTAYSGQVVTEKDWEVREVTGGTVLRVAYDKDRGKYVDVQTAPGVFERYQHMDSICVSVGQPVAQGTVLGIAGSTGDVTGRHLHFGVYVNGTAEANAVSPQAWLGLPNVVGAYDGDDTLDTATIPTRTRRIVGGTAWSDGDTGAFNNLAKSLGGALQWEEV